MKLIHLFNKYNYIIINTINDNYIDIIIQSFFKNYKHIPLNKINKLLGPKIGMQSVWSSNIMNIINKLTDTVISIEKYIITNKSAKYDKMTQELYNFPLDTNIKRKFPKYYPKLPNEEYKSFNKQLTETELYDLLQSNSEHSRHYFFRGAGLMKLIKEPYNLFPNNSLLAFADNSSAIKGYNIKYFKPIFPTSSSIYKLYNKICHPMLTAETHNFPTGICPFQGASTGTGGRIRDNQSIGRGGIVCAQIAGYCVGKSRKIYHTPYKIITDASNGASDYGNKFGEPLIGGFFRTYGSTNVEWVKPIMFSAGIGYVFEENLIKQKPKEGDKIIRIGGPALLIGMGGGLASSKSNINDQSAVQRGDPEMANKLNAVVRSLAECNNNPIKSIHDQGAGGMGNVSKEIVYPFGANINLDKVIIGMPLSATEIWCSEHQEQNTILVDKSSVNIIDYICKRENLPYSIVGEVVDSGKITVTHKNEIVYDLEVEKIFEDKQKNYKLLQLPNKTHKPFNCPITDIYKLVQTVFYNPAVASKSHLVNKVDRSVTGLVVQQQTVGWLQLPLADYQLIALNYFTTKGVVSAVGERPITGEIDVYKMVKLSVGEMLTNMIFCVISNFNDIKCQANWMWAINHKGEGYMLKEAVKELSKIMIQLGIAIDGGKDSLSMSANNIRSPRTLVITGYCTCPDITKSITPDLKSTNSHLIFIDFSLDNNLGGSILAQEYNNIGKYVPDSNLNKLKEYFPKIQKLIKEGYILSGHDRSDGGLITTLLEMSFPNTIGFEIKIEENINVLFSEGLGIVLEVTELKVLNNIKYKYLGKTHKNNYVKIGKLAWDIKYIRNIWMEKSRYYEQITEDCIKMEYDKLYFRNNPQNFVSYPIIHKPLFKIKPKVGILREEGCNGYKELASAFFDVGFEVWDINMYDLSNNNILEQFKCIAFAGGFTYSDVMGAGTGWSQLIKNHPNISRQIMNFYIRQDTISLGICNGCQLMSKIGIIKTSLDINNSQRFESRYVTVKIKSQNNVFLQNMNDWNLGVWCAHKEGKFNTKQTGCIYYSDEYNAITKQYPYSPNGGYIAGISSKNGRHLGMMPHPERSYISWQCPYPIKQTGWKQIFVNAYNWCVKPHY